MTASWEYTPSAAAAARAHARTRRRGPRTTWRAGCTSSRAGRTTPDVGARPSCPGLRSCRTAASSLAAWAPRLGSGGPFPRRACVCFARCSSSACWVARLRCSLRSFVRTVHIAVVVVAVAGACRTLVEERIGIVRKVGVGGLARVAGILCCGFASCCSRSRSRNRSMTGRRGSRSTFRRRNRDSGLGTRRWRRR